MAVEVDEEQKEIWIALRKRINRITKYKKAGCSKQISEIIRDIHKKYTKKHKTIPKEAQNEICKEELPRTKG